MVGPQVGAGVHGTVRTWMPHLVVEVSIPTSGLWGRPSSQHPTLVQWDDSSLFVTSTHGRRGRGAHTPCRATWGYTWGHSEHPGLREGALEYRGGGEFPQENMVSLFE